MGTDEKVAGVENAVAEEKAANDRRVKTLQKETQDALDRVEAAKKQGAKDALQQKEDEEKAANETGVGAWVRTGGAVLGTGAGAIVGLVAGTANAARGHNFADGLDACAHGGGKIGG